MPVLYATAEGKTKRIAWAMEAAADRSSGQAPQAAAPAVTPLRILVVDDNRDAADVLQMLLELQGHHVAVGYDAASALRVVAAFAPDVALLDLGLPGMNGYDLADALRVALAPPPVIVAVSGYGQAHDRARSAGAGFSAHLVKPVDHEALAAALRQVADVRRRTETPTPGPAMPPTPAEVSAAQKLSINQTMAEP